MSAQTTQELYPVVRRLNNLVDFVTWQASRAVPSDALPAELRDAVIELRDVAAELAELVGEGVDHV